MLLQQLHSLLTSENPAQQTVNLLAQHMVDAHADGVLLLQATDAGLMHSASHPELNDDTDSTFALSTHNLNENPVLACLMAGEQIVVLADDSDNTPSEDDEDESA